MDGKSYEERLQCLKLWTLEKRRNRQDLIEVFKMCNGISRLKLNEFFTLAENNIGTRGHSRKLVKFRCIRDCCKYFFSNRVINRWNQLDQRSVEATSINAFKGSLSKIRETRMGFFMDWSAEPWASLVGFLTDRWGHTRWVTQRPAPLEDSVNVHHHVDNRRQYAVRLAPVSAVDSRSFWL